MKSEYYLHDVKCQYRYYLHDEVRVWGSKKKKNVCVMCVCQINQDQRMGIVCIPGQGNMYAC